VNRHTKIVATLGPASEDKTKILELSEAGMDIARLNFSHGSYESFKKIVQNIRLVERENGKTICTLQDLQGPKIRLGELPKEGIAVHKGEILTFCINKKTTKSDEKMCIPLPYSKLKSAVKPENRLLIEDGLIRTKILSINGNRIKALVTAGGILKSHKGVNVPDSILPASEALTEKDKADLHFGIKILKVDAVAISFVESKEDVLRIKKQISKWTKRRVSVISKIERPKALTNLEEIIKASDGIMIARGDLGIEIPAERVPIEQKRIIRMCKNNGKPVIVATQILQSMVENPLPTRAEISDASTAIFEQTDAYMLSNETAVGAYPVKAVRTLAKVAEEVEANLMEYEQTEEMPTGTMEGTLADYSISMQAPILAKQMNANAIVVVTKHGFTANAILRFRPKTPVIVVTNSEETARLLKFSWGINKIVITKRKLRSEEVKDLLKEKGLIKEGQNIVFVSLQSQKRSLVAMQV